MNQGMRDELAHNGVTIIDEYSSYGSIWVASGIHRASGQKVIVKKIKNAEFLRNEKKLLTLGNEITPRITPRILDIGFSDRYLCIEFIEGHVLDFFEDSQASDHYKAGDVLSKFHEITTPHINSGEMDLRDVRSYLTDYLTWFAKFNEEVRPVYLALFNDAFGCLSNDEPQLLLHGDYHCDNIMKISDESGFIIIDPKGVVGPAAYDLGIYAASTKHPVRAFEIICDVYGVDHVKYMPWLLLTCCHVLSLYHEGMQGRWEDCVNPCRKTLKDAGHDV